jgi:glycosyltransferase involved in cell wall biosynthesis
VHVTAGSGVNLEEFPHAPITETPKIVRFCLVSRLLISKGVRVFAEAARRIRARFPNAEFHLIGPFDPNPNRVEESEVAQWVAEGTLKHHGMVKDVASLIQTMHIFCLPTWYREGVPHSTLEALATGRAVITTNSVGAKECVKLTAKGEQQREASESLMEGENGFLCAPQSIDAVEAAMAFYLENPTQIALHGQNSRQLAADVFDVRLVNDIILRAMQLKGSPRSSEDVSIAEPSSFILPHSSF